MKYPTTADFIMQMRPLFEEEEKRAVCQYMDEDGFITEFKRTEQFERMIAEMEREAAERAAFLKSAPLQSRSLASCASSLKKRGVEGSAIARREKAVQNLRQKRGLSTGTLYLTKYMYPSFKRQ